MDLFSIKKGAVLLKTIRDALYRLLNIYQLMNLRNGGIFLITLSLLMGMTWAKKEITFATLAPKSSTWGKLIRDIARDVYKASDKKLIVRVFYGGVHGDEKEMEEKIRFKQLDGGFFTGNGLGLVCDESRVLEVPGLIRNYKQLDYVYDRILDDLNPYFAKNNYVLLGLLDVGYAYFFSKEKINGLDSIRRSKMWIWKGDRLVESVMKKLNIPAVPVSFTEVIPSLQTGYINGVYTTPTALVSLQWHKEVRYRLDFPITLVSSGVVLSKKVWDSLTAQEKKWLQKSSLAQLKTYRKIIRKSDKKTLKLLEEQNIQTLAYRGSVQDFYSKTLLTKSQFPNTLVKKVEALIRQAH